MALFVPVCPDGKDRGEFLKSLTNPFTAIGVIFARFVIQTRQIHPPHAALHHMANRNLMGQKQFRSQRSRHLKISLPAFYPL
ncbi:MAG: hypothetical protein ACK52I_19615, partial [Pseudomonadota bacterium]